MEGVWRAANNLQHAIFGGAHEAGRAQGRAPQIRPAFLLMKGHLLNN